MKKDKAESEASIYTGLVIDNIEYQTLITKKYSNRKAYTPLNPRLLTAFIPGTMTDVYVVAGQEVKAGQCLAILEAMKMLNEIKSPFDTKVKEVNVQKGDRVTKNHVLIELE